MGRRSVSFGSILERFSKARKSHFPVSCGVGVPESRFDTCLGCCESETGHRAAQDTVCVVLWLSSSHVRTYWTDPHTRGRGGGLKLKIGGAASIKKLSIIHASYSIKLEWFSPDCLHMGMCHHRTDGCVRLLEKFPPPPMSP